jgi:Cu/Ag efflux protein CusF
MSSRVPRLMLLALALSTVTMVGPARSAEINGTVQGVDIPSGTVFFTDGRVVRLAPGARLYVGNREVRLADVRPGWVLVTSGPTLPADVVVQSAPPAMPVPQAVPSAVPVNATGVVTQVDARTGTITLQDGRVLRVAPGTTLWQAVSIGSVVPGAAVFVRNAEPLDFQPTTSPAAARPFQMGTVSGVDASNARVILSDGSVVQLRPGAQAIFNGQSLAITELRPGDEVVIGVPSGSTVAVAPSGPAASALPRQALGVIEVDYVYVVRRTQAP